MTAPKRGSKETHFLNPTFCLLAIVLGVGLWFENKRQEADEDLNRQIAELAQSSGQSESARRLEREFDALFDQLSYLRFELRKAANRVEEVGIDADVRIGETEALVTQVGHAIEAQAERISEFDQAQDALGSTWRNALDEQWQELSTALADTREAVQSERAARLNELAQIDARVPERDVVEMWNELMGPVVMLSGDSSVGSGVLLDHALAANEEGHGTYVLTAWHVVRDIQAKDQANARVPVRIYSRDGSTRDEFARLLAKNAELDAALLELRTPEPLPHTAPVAPRSRLAGRHIFDRIYAVGCPLGNDPIPTFGEIATRTHEVDGETYWMINAPTYIGNSGGGIFDADTHELLGIFSKIYTHGSLRPTIVPHMGLATPLDSIYDWLEGEGYALLDDGANTNAVAAVTGE